MTKKPFESQPIGERPEEFQPHLSENEPEEEYEDDDEEMEENEDEANLFQPKLPAEISEAPIPENNDTPEERAEKEKLAAAKLEKLMGEDFTKYGIRFVNLGEYLYILENNKFPRSEIYSDKFYPGKENTPFKEYVHKGEKGEWYNIASNQSHFPGSARQLASSNELLALLKEAHQDTKEDDNTEELRKKTLESLREKIITKIKDEPMCSEESYWRHDFLYLSANYDQIKKDLEKVLSDLKENLKNEQKEKLEAWMREYYFNFPALEEIFGDTETVDKYFKDIKLLWNTKKLLDAFKKEDIELAHQWFKDPTSIDLRSFYNAVVKNQFADESMTNEQYQLALIIDGDGIIPRSEDEKGGWGFIKREEKTPGEVLLGTICAMRNKETLQKIIKLASSSKELCHPVFDSEGNVRYPKVDKKQKAPKSET